MLSIPCYYIALCNSVSLETIIGFRTFCCFVPKSRKAVYNFGMSETCDEVQTRRAIGFFLLLFGVLYMINIYRLRYCFNVLHLFCNALYWLDKITCFSHPAYIYTFWTDVSTPCICVN